MTTTGSRPDALAACVAWLAHPLSVAGLILLLLNDHVLKAGWPGVVTGKLSDAAGMLMFPPLLAVLLAAVLPRVRAGLLAAVAVCATGTVFGAVKASGEAAELASRTWTIVNGPSIVLADPTDLLVLPVLALSWVAWRRARHGRVTRRWVMLVLVPIGLFATVATTAMPGPESVTWVGEVDGKPAAGYIEVRRGLRDPAPTIAVSDDGGRTFDDLPPPPSPAATAPPSPAATVPRELPRRAEACAGPHCYRIVRGELHVQESHDAGRTWATAWQITGWQYRALIVDHRDIVDAAVELSSQSVAIVGPEDDHIVLVANGRDGLVRRDGPGRWERVGVGRHITVPLRAMPDFTGHRVMSGMMGLIAVMFTGLGMLVLRHWRSLPRARLRAFFILAPAAVLYDMCALFPQWPSVLLWLVWGAVSAVGLLACAAIAVPLYRLGRVPALAALAATAGATVWYAQASVSLEPVAGLELYPIWTGMAAVEAAQTADSLLPVALGMVAAAVIAPLFSRAKLDIDSKLS